MTFDGDPDIRTWVLRNHKTKSDITITLTVDVVLTVALSQDGGPSRRDQRKLKDYAGALAYVNQFILERKVRGFQLVRDSYREAMKAEAEEKAKAKAEADANAPRVNPRVARVVAAGTVLRDGWVAISCERHIGDAVFDALVTDTVDTVQLICDGGDGDKDGEGVVDDDHGVPLSARCLRQLLRVARPGLRTLVLDTHWQTLVRQVDDDYGNRWGDLGVGLNLQPALERVYAAGIFAAMTPLQSERLRDFSVISANLSGTLKGLQQSTLPALVRLGVAGSLEEHIDDDAMKVFESLLRSEALPALTHLDVDGAPDPIGVLEAAAHRGLRGVCVAGDLGDEDDALPRLLALAPQYAEASVSLALDTLSAEATNALKAAWPGLVDSDNHGLFLPGRYTTVAVSPSS